MRIESIKQARGGETSSSIRAAQAQEELIQAAIHLKQSEEKLSPAEQRGICRLKTEIETFLSQRDGKPNESVECKLLLPELYSQRILQSARTGTYQNPMIINAAQNYLQKEDLLRNAYLRDAWEEIRQTWKNSPTEWQNYYRSQWDYFSKNASDPWKAFAEDISANAAQQEKEMKKAAEKYLQYEKLSHTQFNPFTYPQLLSAADPFPQQQFSLSGIPTQNPNNPLNLQDYYLTPLLTDHITVSMYGNIKSGMDFMQKIIQGIGGWQSSCFYPGMQGFY